MLTQVASNLVFLIRPSDLAMAMAGLFLFSCLAQYYLTQKKQKKKKGPMHWPLLGILPSLFLHLGDIYDWTTAILSRSGGTFPYHGVWLGGAHGVITSDPANVEHILRTRFANFPKGRYYRERFADLLGDGIFNADGDAWRAQRRAATSEMHSPRFAAYSAASIASLVHGKLLPLLSRLAADGGAPAVDLQDILLRFTFDNICLAAFGVDPGCLAADDLDLPEVPFARAFERATELTLVRFIVPPFVWKPMRRLGLGPERELRAAVRVVHEFADRTVSRRRAEFTSSGSLHDRSDLLSRLVEATTEEEEEVVDGVGCCNRKKLRFSDKFIRDFCISFILAGRDTSSVALAWFFWLLHGRPSQDPSLVSEHGRSRPHLSVVARPRPLPSKPIFATVTFADALVEHRRHCRCICSPKSDQIRPRFARSSPSTNRHPTLCCTRTAGHRSPRLRSAARGLHARLVHSAPGLRLCDPPPSPDLNRSG